MIKVARFERVSYNEFSKSLNKDLYETNKLYEEIKLPKRATSGSAGYDFYSPIDIVLKPKEICLVPSGVRVWIDEGWVLKCYPRSSMGFKYNMTLLNTVGIIDSDYYNADNEGHIMFKICNGSNDVLEIKKGDRFVQGIFIPFGITVDDDSAGQRHGGFGSTN